MSAVKLSSLPVGALLDVEVKPDWQSRFGSIITWRVADQGHEGYPAGCTTLITDKIIQLMCFDAAEPGSNFATRAQNGNNRYVCSNIHQWLNSVAIAGQWFSPQHQYDAPPTSSNVESGANAYDQWAGFLWMLDDGFVAALMDTMLTIVKTPSDGGGYESFVAKMFLASRTEVGLGDEGSIAEGSILALFRDGKSRKAYPTAQAVNSNDYVNASLHPASVWYWWIRTLNASYAQYVRRVELGGAYSYTNAYSGLQGIRPLCNLPGDTDVELSVTGNYVLAGPASSSKGRIHGVMGGVLRPTSVPMPVIGGVRRIPTALRATIGGVLREVWPVTPPPALDQYSWAQIAQMAQDGTARNYLALGDEKTLILNGERYHAQIIGFDHDDLSSEDPLYTSNYNAGCKKAAITFQLAEITTQSYPMRNSQTNAGGWRDTDMRNTTMVTFRGYMPAELQASLRTVVKLTSAGNMSSEIIATADNLFLLAREETYGPNHQEGPFPGEGTQYAYYATRDSPMGKYRPNGKGPYGGWWLRTPSNTNGISYMVTGLSFSTAGYTPANFMQFLSFAFCV